MVGMTAKFRSFVGRIAIIFTRCWRLPWRNLVRDGLPSALIRVFLLNYSPGYFLDILFDDPGSQSD